MNWYNVCVNVYDYAKTIISYWTSWLKYYSRNKEKLSLCVFCLMQTLVYWCHERILCSFHLAWLNIPDTLISLDYIMLCYSSAYSKVLLLGMKDLNAYPNIEKKKCLWSSLLPSTNYNLLKIVNLSYCITWFEWRVLKIHTPFDRTVICKLSR